jgi:putative aldouronate transport system permease protein
MLKSKKKGFFYKLSKQRELVLLSLPFFIYILIFSYLPLWGLTMSFQNFKPNRTFFQQEWVGLLQFKLLFSDASFVRVIRNTLAMGIINLTLGFVTSIAFALLLNELISSKFRRIAQSISYMPHFLAWIIVASLVSNMLSVEDGIVNKVLLTLGVIDKEILFLGKPNYFWWIVGWTNVWKEMGWNTIIYMAAITSIDPSSYEAAEMDGANRLQKNLYITLPGIKSTIVILLIMNVGWILNSGFEIQYLLGNGIVSDVSETIDIFVLKRGLAQNNYSLATAAGMFKTVVSITLIGFCNWLAGRMGEEKLI